VTPERRIVLTAEEMTCLDAISGAAGNLYGDAGMAYIKR